MTTKGVYIFSTHSTDVAYTKYKPQTDPKSSVLPELIHTVTIKGGAGVIDKRLHTPAGVLTEVTPEDLAFLMTDPNFLRHQKDGYIVVEGHKFDSDIVGADMNQRDGSRQATPNSFVKSGKTGDAAQK